MLTRQLTLFLLLIIIPGSLFSQSGIFREARYPVKIGKLSQPLNFDGDPDEEAWNSIETFNLVMHIPVFGKEPTENTEVRIAYDEKYIYIGAQLYYNDIDLLQSSSFKRDYMGLGSDFLGITLDTYNDKENGVLFITTPDGLRYDASIQRDAVITDPNNQKPKDINWNTFWDVLTQINEKGWSVEMRIPLSSLRFQNIDGIVKMGVIIQRWIPAKNEIDIYPSIPPNWGDASPIKPSQAQEIIFEGITPEKPLYIAPYLLSGYESRNDLNGEGTSYLKTGKPIYEAGLDVKYGISSNIILDLTVNTDFAQVENDDEKINMTRMAEYFPEKRMFFLERSSIFDFNSNGTNNLFYSRRIGLSDDGDPIRIYGGARLTGKAKKWDFGVLDMQTAPLMKKIGNGVAKEIKPSENFGVMRLRRKLINDNSYVGSMITSRLGADGSFNIGYGLDGLLRFKDNDYISLLWSQTFEDSVKNSTVFDPARFLISYERRSKKGFISEIAYMQSGINYNPGIGFESYKDFSLAKANLRFGIFPGEKSSFFWHAPEIRFKYFRYISDGSLMSYSAWLGWNFQLKNQWQGNLFLVYSVENLRENLKIIKDEIYINPGRYDFTYLTGQISSPASKSFFALLKIETGQYYDGNKFSASLEPTWNFSKHLEIGGIFSFDYANFSERGLKLNNQIAGIRLLYMLNTRFSLNAFLQYNTEINEIISNVRLRYNPKEGNDLYIMFNEGRNTKLYREIPELPVYNTRSVMIKYTYTFSF